MRKQYFWTLFTVCEYQKFLMPQNNSFNIMTISAVPLHQIMSKVNCRSKKLAFFGNFRRHQNLISEQFFTFTRRFIF